MDQLSTDQNTKDQNTAWAAEAWLGMDVSKDTLHACLITQAASQHFGEFQNTKEGFAKLLKWSQRLAPKERTHFCIEATGAYSRAIALFLVEKEQHVTLANPMRTKHAGLARGQDNKTDKADGRNIALWCRDNRPALWRVTRSQMRELIALVHHLDALTRQSVQHKNRLSEPGLIAVVEASLRKMLEQTEEQIEQIQKAIRDLIDNDPDLRQDRDLLVSIPGIGELTAARLLAEMPDVREFSSASSVARYAGLNPREYQSGTSVRKSTRISRSGNSHLRCAVYMAALSASRTNPPVRRFCERLLAHGKAKKAVICAAMRKLLMIAYGVLRHRKPFNENHLPAVAQMA